MQFPLSFKCSLSPVQAAECQVFSISESSLACHELSAGPVFAQFKGRSGNLVRRHLTEYDTMNTKASAMGQLERYIYYTPCVVTNLQLNYVIKYARPSGQRRSANTWQVDKSSRQWPLKLSK